ncbi:nucleoside hydrolase [uncultured Bifidobacterium sp.]|mgnify:CR=1 FL=1|uniref:nucleoside hydrolase n=1 Tax=uncultured Bifidobacterium sp. TaxID=165187 RepID=UPI002618B003|nr:nucleoside hydrolase [uncultured Bifidobacterium sp.]
MDFADDRTGRRMILDVDTGIDDALALAYLASFTDINLLGVIGTYGNVAVDTAVRNTEYVLERLGLRHIPVMRGSAHPSWARCFVPDAGCAQFHGIDGLGGFGPVPLGSTADFLSTDSSSSVDRADCAQSTDRGRIIGDRPIRTIRLSPMENGGELFSIGGYPLHDIHANPSIDDFSFSFAFAADGDVDTNGTAGNTDIDDDGDIPEGVRFLIDQIRRFGRDVTVVATGPLTDIDMAIAEAPDITRNLRLVMMGGSLTQEGNCWDLTAETNMIQDPEAADRVFHSGADITMVGLDVTHQCLLGGTATRRWRDAASLRGQSSEAHRRAPAASSPSSAQSETFAQPTSSRVSAQSKASVTSPAPTPSAASTPSPQRMFSPQTLRFLADIADFSIAANLKADARLFSAGMPLHDPLAAAVAVDPTLVSCIDLPMKVETQTGDFHGTRGRTIGDPEGLINPGAPRVHVALNVDAKRFLDEFSTRIAGN